MKRLNFDRVFSAIAVAVWMAVIFLFSAQTGETSGNTSGSIVKLLVGFFWRDFDQLSAEEQLNIMDNCQLFIRKSGHFLEYAVLSMLSANALRTYRISKGLRWIIPVSVCFVYAVSDEIHQLFVAGRACRFLDVCIDTAGGLFGTAVFMLAFFLLSKRREKFYNKTKNT